MICRLASAIPPVVFLNLVRFWGPQLFATDLKNLLFGVYARVSIVLVLLILLVLVSMDTSLTRSAFLDDGIRESRTLVPALVLVIVPVH